LKRLGVVTLANDSSTNAVHVPRRRCRFWCLLLRLYPRPFRQPFGVGMTLTYPGRRPFRPGLCGRALWIFF
jgi:hypothetical protein